MRRTMKAVRGHLSRHTPKRLGVCPTLKIKAKNPGKPLPFVEVIKTGERGIMRKKPKEFVLVFLQSGKWKKFKPDEVREIELVEKTKKKEEAKNG